MHVHALQCGLRRSELPDREYSVVHMYTKHMLV